MKSPLIVALDFPEAAPALDCARRLDPRLCRVKIGKELFTAAGPRVVADVRRLGFEVFLDLKYHDIPQTVAGACKAAAHLGVWMVNVHASGGPRMLRAAREALGDGAGRPLLVGVTVLTSMDAAELRSVGIASSPLEQVQRLATLTAAAGLDGVVCSPLETTVLRASSPEGFLLVTPGVRPAGAAANDQARVATPAQAMAGGADFLVLGRPVTAAPDPVAALHAVLAEIGVADE